MNSTINNQEERNQLDLLQTGFSSKVKSTVLVMSYIGIVMCGAMCMVYFGIRTEHGNEKDDDKESYGTESLIPQDTSVSSAESELSQYFGDFKKSMQDNQVK